MANRSSSNFDYPTYSKILKPPDEQNADTFVPLQPSQQNNNE